MKYWNVGMKYEYNLSEKESVFHAATLLLKSTSFRTSVVTNNSRSIYSTSETLNFVGGSNRMKYSTLGNDWSPKKSWLVLSNAAHMQFCLNNSTTTKCMFTYKNIQLIYYIFFISGLHESKTNQLKMPTYRQTDRRLHLASPTMWKN